jgi:hypothetical protein
MAAAAPQDGGNATTRVVVDFSPFAALPPALAHKIFATLPAYTRLRCAEVCTAWCALVAERSLWTRLDLSVTSGVTHEITPALLRAAAAKARGALTALDVSGVWHQLYRDRALREVVAANAGALRELRCFHGRGGFWTVPMLEALLSAAPQLRVCEADVHFSDAADARCALRYEGVFGPLRVGTASICVIGADAAMLVSLMPDVAAHASLTELQLYGASLDVPEALDAFVDAALSLPLLRTVELSRCRLSPASAPALTRLLSGNTLNELSIQNDGRALLDAPAATLLGDALRAARHAHGAHALEHAAVAQPRCGGRAAGRTDGARPPAQAAHHC